MQQVRNELVVAFQVQIADVKKDNLVSRFRTLAENFNRAAMTLEQGAQVFRHERQPDHFSERTIGQLWNNASREAVFRRRLNHEGQLRGGFGDFHGSLRRRVLRAVNDVAPMNQIFEWPRIKSKFVLRYRSDEFGARAIVWLIKHVRDGMFSKLPGILRSEERALVMIEPPGQFRRVRILEVHDHILIA